MRQDAGFRMLLCLLLATVLCGCQSTDPLTRDRGEWHPAGVNESDLALQVANPEELVHGSDDQQSNVGAAIAAIQRLRTDKVKPLQNNSIVSLGSGGS